MKKDAYFFPHFCNARHDRKIKRVMKELGIEGYAIYFMLLEVLREQMDFKYPVEDIDLLADEFKTSEQKILTVICNYNLFEVDEEQKFFSTKLVFYMQPYIEKSNRARLAANKRWEKAKLQMSDANAYANALQEQSEDEANAMQGEESKQKESKEVYREFKHLSITVIEKDRILKDGYTINQLDYILDSIENYAKNKNYTSLNLTARKWLKKEYGEPKKQSETTKDNDIDWSQYYDD